MAIGVYARKTFWTAARIDELRQLVANDLSASQIATALGTTRNAVIGKCARDRLQLTGEHMGGRRTGGFGFGEARPKPPRQNPKPAPKERPSFVALTDDTLARLAAIPDIARIASLLDLEDHHCKYPIGEPLTGFCGSERVRGTAASSGRSTLIATLRSCFMSCARYTVAIPPCPSSRSIR